MASSNYFYLIIVGVFRTIPKGLENKPGEQEIRLVQWCGAAAYTDCFSAEGLDSLNECHEYDTKQPSGEALVMPGIWGMWSTLSLPSLPGPLWPGVGAPDRDQSMG